MNHSLRIDIDPNSGFCFGVTAAITKAQQELTDHGTLMCLGDIVHNSAEMKRLAREGLKTITHEDLSDLNEGRVLLRAHGEPPSTYICAQNKGITLIDATCPVVLKLQQRIKSEYLKALNDGSDLQIIIFGQPGHAEVNGLVGQTQGTAIVIEGPDQLDRIDFNKDIALYSQTTKSVEGFSTLIKLIETKRNPNTSFRHYDTICRQVANRVQALKEFASSHDIILFVAGEKSSNAKVLYHHCKTVNNRSHIINTTQQLKEIDYSGASNIGICGATSTPRWQLEETANLLKNLLCETL